ncbi:OmpA family protein [Emcibacter sp. SYSU 3D8]|uniref:OmpA family protein n=1 Tax=Emcibacter sp. SYSU 3D8 TaxID=3133969 RepID=UPI0031FEDCFE
MTHHVFRSGLLALALAAAPLACAAAQEGDGIDINMDALKNRPTDTPPPQAAPATAAPESTKPAKVKTFTGRSVMVLFEPGSAALEAGATRRLDEIAAQSGSQRLELKAYAGTEKQSASDTRRLALQRAIAVRGYLMGKGMDGTRIAVRPQGPAHDGQAPERVDVRFLQE